MDLGPIGVWWSGSWQVTAHEELEAATELEALGYGAIWSSGGMNPGLSSRFGRVLDATERVVVASGIVNVWLTPPEELAAAVEKLEESHPGRFLLGLGASHARLVPGYSRPLSHMAEYLDRLDALGTQVGPSRRILAALRPRMLELARDRSLGAHPYFVPAAHTARARELLGSRSLLAPEVAVVLDDDPDRAMNTGRGPGRSTSISRTTCPTCGPWGSQRTTSTRGGSARLIEAVVAWGNADMVARRLHEHLDAGADHVCVQVVGAAEGFPLGEYRSVALALGL